MCKMKQLIILFISLLTISCSNKNYLLDEFAKTYPNLVNKTILLPSTLQKIADSSKMNSPKEKIILLNIFDGSCPICYEKIAKMEGIANKRKWSKKVIILNIANNTTDSQIESYIKLNNIISIVFLDKNTEYTTSLGLNVYGFTSFVISKRMIRLVGNPLLDTRMRRIALHLD